MRQMTIRGLKLFFRDKSGVFFSLLGVIIIFCLFVFFISDLATQGLDFLDNASYIMNSWMVAGMLASSAITTSMGAYAVMVTDNENKCIKDFASSPIRRSSVTAGYMLTGFIVSVIMSILTLAFGEIYILIKGGELVGFPVMMKVLGVILLSSFASSAMVCFVVSFLRTSNAYTTVSIILGTLIGFLVGAYISVGDLPNGVQWVVKCFPCAHAAALFRQLLMGKAMDTGFANLPASSYDKFKLDLGVTYKYGDWVAEPWLHIAVLIATGIIFYAFALLNISRKRNQY
ncbi:ABC-2 type transporter [[Clostridium] cellulosi]|uniref:ABC-2 type transporter n=1 Tax=[Clostridium] cellulosi TaxID=29343 RepID=A0A078KM47_9FIRM|nr:ABC-2 type transporter [[Clostridium] cellulosi]